MWSFWLEWEQSSYLLNHQGKKEPKSRSLIRTSTSILKGSQEAELTCEAAGEATRSSVSGKQRENQSWTGKGGSCFPPRPVHPWWKPFFDFALTNVHSYRDCKEGGDCNLKKKEKKKKRTKLDEKYPRKSLPASPAPERVRLCWWHEDW